MRLVQHNELDCSKHLDGGRSPFRASLELIGRDSSTARKSFRVRSCLFGKINANQTNTKRSTKYCTTSMDLFDAVLQASVLMNT